MHSRQSRHALILFQAQVPSRTAATATNPAPRSLGKWEPPQSAVSNSSKPDPSSNKWAPPTNPGPPPLPYASKSSQRPSSSNMQQRFRPLDSMGSSRRLSPAAGEWTNPSFPSASDMRGPSSDKKSIFPFPKLERPERPPSNRSNPPFAYTRTAGASAMMDIRRSRQESDFAPHLRAERKNPSWVEQNTRSRPKLEGKPIPSSSVLRFSKSQKSFTASKSDVIAANETDETSRDEVLTSPLAATTLTEDLPDETDEPFDDLDVRHVNNSPARNPRDAYKTRGSIVDRIAQDKTVEIAQKPRVSDVRTKPKEKKRKLKSLVQPRSLEVFIPSVITVGNLSRLLNVRLGTLQRCMINAGMDKESSYDHMLSADYASLLAEEFNRKPVVNDEEAFDIYPSPPPPNPTTLPHRPPIVTIMGHVDHGKTTLLDTLRSSSVAKGEAGGITQHIGAFSVSVPSAPNTPDAPRTITFLDTPGHAAFSAMRSRGAQVTDIIVLVVAADDGVMPQTKEVIDLIKKDGGKLGIVVAINKVDKPGVDIEKVRTSLWAAGLELEVMGGDIPSVEVSGFTGHGLDQLVETISALAEIRDLRAEREGNAYGYILESKVQKGLGASATVILLSGSLTPSSHVISGVTHAKLKQLTDASGKSVKSAYPGMAVTVSGWKDLPRAGDEVLQGTENDVKKAAQNRLRKVKLEATLNDVEAINKQRQFDRETKETSEGADMPGNMIPSNITPGVQALPKELRLIIKGDMSGSVEAVSTAVQGMGNKHAVVDVVFSGVGDVTESDVMTAKTIDGMIVAFSVSIPRATKAAAAQVEVPIFTSSIIYDVIDEVKSRVVALLPKTVEKRVTGEATVLQLFDVQGKHKSLVKVAGCRVVNGLVERSRHARIIRNGHTIFEGAIETLRYLKKDVSEVKKGSECGLSFNKFHDVQEGDFIQSYQEIEKPGQL